MCFLCNRIEGGLHNTVFVNVSPSHSMMDYCPAEHTYESFLQRKEKEIHFELNGDKHIS